MRTLIELDALKSLRAELFDRLCASSRGANIAASRIWEDRHRAKCDALSIALEALNAALDEEERIARYEEDRGYPTNISDYPTDY